MKLPNLITHSPARTRKDIARDTQVISPSYTRGYPMVAKSGRGAMVEDVDGNTFLDFAAGIAVAPRDTVIRASSKRFKSRLPS